MGGGFLQLAMRGSLIESKRISRLTTNLGHLHVITHSNCLPLMGPGHWLPAYRVDHCMSNYCTWWLRLAARTRSLLLLSMGLPTHSFSWKVEKCGANKYLIFKGVLLKNNTLFMYSQYCLKYIYTHKNVFHIAQEYHMARKINATLRSQEILLWRHNTKDPTYSCYFLGPLITRSLKCIQSHYASTLLGLWPHAYTCRCGNRQLGS